MKPRLLVTGGAGFLGTYLLQRAKHFTVTGTLHHTPAAALPNVAFHVCDLAHPETLNALLDRVQPEVIIHTACSDRKPHLSTIAKAASWLAMATVQRSIRLIHLSTDQVFDGTSAPYTERCTPCPINPYGIAKAEAESLVSSLNPQATIIRTSIIYDLRTPDRQIQGLIQLTQSDESFRLFVDEWRSMIWIENLVDALLELATREYPGILHLGGPQALNRWEAGRLLLQHFKVPLTPNIQKGTIEQSGMVRAPNLTLDSTTAKQFLQTPLLSLPEARRSIQLS